MVAEAVDNFRVFAHPGFQAAFLLMARGMLLAIAGNDRWFEMIGQSEYDVCSSRSCWPQGLPRYSGENFSSIGELFFQPHSFTASNLFKSQTAPD